ncbi:MAG: PPC domain-containing protein [Fuerstiella sp.]|nr:PPC domain-containing protein [Fuerstiella sp.]
MSSRLFHFCRCLVAPATVLLGSCFVAADPPKAIRVEPLAVAPGETSEILLHGLYFADATDVWSSLGSGSDASRLNITNADNQYALPPSSHKASDRISLLSASVAQTCPVGIHAVRLATVEGISNPLLFMVDDLPTVIGAKDNHSLKTAQTIELPIAIDGMTESGQADYFQSPGSRGEWVSVEAVATRLGTRLDPVIRILDAAGQELIFLDDSPGLSGDCRVRFQRPESGTFVVSIEDASQGGNSAYQYRLRIGDFPLVSGTVPAVVNQTQVSELRAVGHGVEEVDAMDTVLSAASHRIAVSRGDKLGSGFAKLFESDLAQFVGAGNSACDVQIPCGLSGVLTEPDDVHLYRFDAAKGDRIVLSDKSRQSGVAAMLGLEIRDESGRNIGVNRRPGTAGGTLTVTVPEDGQYVAEISEIGRRSGPEFVYYAELQRSRPDFELMLDSASIILPVDGYSIVKVSTNRNGYNGPINLHVNGPAGELTVASNVIAEKKKDTRLKIYIPNDMQPGQTLPLTVSGTSDLSNADKDTTSLQKVASTVSLLRKAMPQTPHPPVELQNVLAAVVGPAIPEFFGLSLDDGAVFFPRHVGEVYFTVRVKERADGFTAPVALRVEGLPEGFRVSGGDNAVGRSENNEYRFQLNGPAEADVGVREIRIIGEASFKGQTKEVTLTKLPFRIIEPLIVKVKSEGTAKAGGEQQLNVRARRFVPRAGGDMKKILLQLKVAPKGVTLQPGGMIAAAKDDAQLGIKVAADVRPGTYDLVLQAQTEVAGHDLTVSSAPFQLVVVPK